MKNGHKLTRKDFELEPSPVWVEENNVLKPSPFFNRWWQQVAQQRFGDKERWLEVAQNLGYVWWNGDPIGFGYDPIMARVSLGIPEGMPLVNQTQNSESYQQLRSWLLTERREHGE